MWMMFISIHMMARWLFFLESTHPKSKLPDSQRACTLLKDTLCVSCTPSICQLEGQGTYLKWMLKSESNPQSMNYLLTIRDTTLLLVGYRPRPSVHNTHRVHYHDIWIVNLFQWNILILQKFRPMHKLLNTIKTCRYNLVTMSTFLLQGKGLPVMPSQNARGNSQLQERSILGKIKLTPRLPYLVWLNQGSLHLCSTYALHVNWNHGTHYLLCCQDFSSPFF